MIEVPNYGTLCYQISWSLLINLYLIQHKNYTCFCLFEILLDIFEFDHVLICHHWSDDCFTSMKQICNQQK